MNEALRLIRVFHDKKAKDLADELGISVAYLSKIENGQAAPSLDLLQKYADIFNTTRSALLFFADNLENEKKLGKFKVAIRNKLFLLLKALEWGDDEDDKDDKELPTQN